VVDLQDRLPSENLGFGRNCPLVPGKRKIATLALEIAMRTSPILSQNRSRPLARRDHRGRPHAVAFARNGSAIKTGMGKASRPGVPGQTIKQDQQLRFAACFGEARKTAPNSAQPSAETAAKRSC